jgi:hypothetical protein
MEHELAAEAWTRTASVAPRVPVLQRALGWAATVGTIPYLTLKLAWLAGSDVGTARASAISDGVMVVGNAVTVGADVVLIGVAMALSHAWGSRLPAWTLLVPGWVATGFLIPIAVSIVPAVAAFAATGTVPGDGSLEPWVGPLVYGGFAWQGVFLAAAFAWNARTRWRPVIARTAAQPVAGVSMTVALAVSAAVIAAGLHVAAGLSVPLPHLPLAVFALVGAVGLVVLWSSRTERVRWFATIAVWCGSAAPACTGLYTTLLAVAVTGYAIPVGAAVFAQVTGLVAGTLVGTVGLRIVSRPAALSG